MAPGTDVNPDTDPWFPWLFPPFQEELLLWLLEYFPLLFEFSTVLPELSTTSTSSVSAVTPPMSEGSCARLALLAPWYCVYSLRFSASSLL